jgi:putative heme-binding domain-containing protein
MNVEDSSTNRAWRSGAVLVWFAMGAWLSAAGALNAQSIPKERRITYREQSLTPYDPFPADEMWKRIKIPPAPALTPAEALKSFKVAPGFRIECIAAEPLVVDPVTFEFDPDGRIWAVEFRGWMLDINGTGEGDPIGKVVVLEDTDGDTIMDKSTVFLDKLVMPRAVSFVQGGVLVAEPPNLWFCQDEDGDLKCDRKTLVGQYGRPGNPEHTENGLMPALDNWMYSANATKRHKFADGKLVEAPTRYRGQWGISQDNYGRLFYNYESSPLHGDLFPADYLSRNRHLSLGEGVNVDIAAGAHEVFPIRVTPGITLGANELRDDGTLRTFTIACGPSIYRGDQFPAEFQRTAVIPEAAGNLVRLDMLHDQGARISARNAFNQFELVASTDERFRPVCSRTGPDGAVYVCDLYRGIIEHVIFMMPYLRNQILSRGLENPVGLGRIYRISHEGKPLGPSPKLSRATSPKLVETLSHPNGWWRDTAQRLLVERKALDATDALQKLVRNGPDHLGRIHALWTLEGIGALDQNIVTAALKENQPWVRVNAIRLSEAFLDAERINVAFEGLKAAFDDDREVVRLQLLFTLGEVAQAKPTGAGAALRDQAEQQMAEILVAAPSSLFRTAALSGLSGRELEFAERLMKHPGWTEAIERRVQVIDTLAMAATDEGDPQRMSRLLSLAEKAGPAWQADAIVAGIATSQRSGARWPEPIALACKPALLDKLAAASDAGRQRAGQLHRILTWPGDTYEHPRRPELTPLTPEQQKRIVLGEAVYNITCHACHKQDGRGMAGQAPPLADSDWVNGDPQHLVRIALHGLRGPIKVNGKEWNLTMPGLGQSPVMNDERLAGVLTYVRRAWGNYGEAVDPEFVAKIRESAPGRTALWTVEELLHPESASPAKPAEKIDPLARFLPGLAGGDAERGRELFHRNLKVRCNACHKVNEMGGGFVGPDLSDVGARNKPEYLLESLIDPSAKISKGFNTLVIITSDGQIVSGTLASEDEESIVIAPPNGGTVTVAKSKIEERVLSPISSMPPMGEAFTTEEVADLVAYLSSLKTAPRKEAAPTSAEDQP